MEWCVYSLFSLGCAIWIFERVNNREIFISRTKNKLVFFHNMFSTQGNNIRRLIVWISWTVKALECYGFGEIFTFGQQYAICLQLILIIALYLLQHAFAFNRNDFAAMFMAMNFKHQIFAFISIQLTQIHFPYMRCVVCGKIHFSFLFSCSLIVFALQCTKVLQCLHALGIKSHVLTKKSEYIR